jgi:hypothetical protein
MIGFVMTDKELRVLPKYGLTLEEVVFAIGTPDLVKCLRRIGALVPAKTHGKTLIFDVGAVAAVWGRYLKGEYDAQLEETGRGNGKRALN